MADTNADTDAKDVLRLQEQMQTERVQWEGYWDEVSRFVQPGTRGFVNKSPKSGEKNTASQYDSTAETSSQRAAAAANSLLCPDTDMWHGLEGDDDDVNNNPQAKQWFSLETKGLFLDRYAVTANFTAQNLEALTSCVVFGTGVLFVDENPEGGLLYASIPLAQVYLLTDNYGRPDIVHRRFELTAHAAVQLFGDATPETIRKVVEKEPLRKFWFIHCTRPNDSYEEGKADRRGMKMASFTVFEEERTTIQRGGYHVMPYAIARFYTRNGESYGRSDAMAALADVKMLNQVKLDFVEHSQRSLRAPLLTSPDGVLGRFQLKPNSITVGGLNSSGVPMVRPMDVGGQPQLAGNVMEQTREDIKETLGVALFSAILNSPKMTQMQLMEMVKEKASLLGPSLGRFQSEYFGALIDRELDIRARQGRMTPVPPVLRGRNYKVRYVSPLNRMMKASAVSSILQTLEAIAPLVQLDPAVRHHFDFTKAARKIAEATGVEDILNPPELAAQRAEAEAQQAALAQGAQLAQPVGRAARDLAEAEAVAAPQEAAA